MAKDQQQQMPAQKQIPNEIVDGFIEEYEAQNTEKMGHLHNRFVAFISEAKIPLPNVIMVLQMLLKEAMEMAEKKYLKG